MREIQYLEVRQEQVFERTQIEVDGVDAGQFKVVFMHPTTLKPNATKNYISMNATASELKSAVKDYYQFVVNCDIDVTRTMFNADGNETTNATEVVKSIYNITLTRLISGQSVSSIMTTKTGSTATVTVRAPSVVQQSSPPLTGRWRVQCKDERGYISLSDSIHVGAHPITIEQVIMRSCSKLNNKIQVW